MTKNSARMVTGGSETGLPAEETLAGKAIREYEERVVAEAMAKYDVSQYLKPGK